MIHPLLPALIELQHQDGYLRPEAITQLSQQLQIPANQIYSVATFYQAFRFKPRGRHQIKVCMGAACYVKDAQSVFDAFSDYLNINADQDTTEDQCFTLNKVACLGCCMLAVAVQIDQHIFGHVTPRDIPNVIRDFLRQVQDEQQESASADSDHHHDSQIRICRCSSCKAAGSAKVYKAFEREKNQFDFEFRLKEVSCHGLSYRAPLVTIFKDGMNYHYDRVQPHHCRSILAQHFKPSQTMNRAKWKSHVFFDGLYKRPSCDHCQISQGDLDQHIEQSRLITKNSGITHPESLSEYQEHGGMLALKKALTMKPQSIIECLKDARLRGRGGGGFPTGEKWRLAYEAQGTTKYVICNADEGDPGAFMDRMLLESFPYRVLEGILIASHFLKAQTAIIYIREEYAQAINVLERTINHLRNENVLDLLSPGFEIILFNGAGAFVCGEETALLASVEGERGIPRKRPPFPVTSGLGGFPTLINNVETFACVPVILQDDGQAFNAIGTPASHGTKAFALAGKVKNGGLIEVPIGISIHDIVQTFGGGAEDGHQIKAVMIGGPSGGCIPRHRFDLPVDYETLQQSGAMMGSGGLIVLDERDCMVDLSLYYLRFLKDESCGKCVPCREGIIRLCELLEQLVGDQPKDADLLDQITLLAKLIQQGSLCALGRTAPNMVLSALHEFADEFTAHLHGCCPSGKCAALSNFTVTDDCIGCTKCAQACPADAIAVTPLEHATIMQQRCTKCGACRTVCPQKAITSVAEQTTTDQIHNQTPLSTTTIPQHSKRRVESNRIEVDGREFPYDERKTLLDYANENDIDIPTLCHLKDDSQQHAHCMVCAAWDQTLGRFVPSCEQHVESGHVYQTNSPSVQAFRQQALGLMLNRHDFQCRDCNVNGSCGFLGLLGKHRVKKKKSIASYPEKIQAKHITFDQGKCILCHRCLTVCNQELTVHHRGGQSCISPVPDSWDNISMSKAQAIAQICPTGALSQRTV